MFKSAQKEIKNNIDIKVSLSGDKSLTKKPS